MNPMKEPNRIENYNRAFEEVIASRAPSSNINSRYKYLKVNKSTGEIGTTENKNEASPLKDINEVMAKVKKSNLSANQGPYQKLANNFKQFIETLPHQDLIANQIITKMTHPPDKRFALDEETTAHAKDEKTNYGGHKAYEKMALAQQDAGFETEFKVNQLQKIGLYEQVGIEDIAEALSKEIDKKINPSKPEFIHFAISNALHSLTQWKKEADKKGEAFDPVSAEEFVDMIQDELDARNVHKEEIDKETFREMLSKKTQKLPESVTGESAEKLIFEFNSGAWKDGETRTLEYQEIDENMMNKYVKTLSRFKTNAHLQAVLDQYFKV